MDRLQTYEEYLRDGPPVGGRVVVICDYVDESVDRGHPSPPREVLEMELGIRPVRGDT